ncbi:beach-domain-containing protein [Sporormia fimetaria CBS 119925]|uniref:Beige protein homolog 1 n=1 Tax=Sporormia fimetaria CBS 119925 TaxID=1340428 RepID=A0A6A6UYU7_9PLEO|nr:beach-domain-containing protein [Sporormia fimetaria CBS 119925]
MTSLARRHRSSTAASRMPQMNDQIAELRSLADELINAAQTSPPTTSVLHAQSSALRRMRQLLIDSHEQTQTKDAFRYVRGFDVLLQTLRSLSPLYDPSTLSPPDRIDFFDVIKAALDVLSDALEGHSGNRRFFAKRVEGGGWVALQNALAEIGIVDGDDYAGMEQLFGTFFAFALGEDDMTRVFRNVGGALEGDANTQGPENTSQAQIDTLQARVRKVFSGNEVLKNPDILPIIVHFWQCFCPNSESESHPHALSVSILLAVLETIHGSTYNKAAVHVTGLLSTILQLLFDGDCGPVEAQLLRQLAESLVEFGINQLDDAYYLFRKASTSVQAAEFLREGIQSSRGPPFIQFDLSLDGFSAIELPDIGKPFPPVSPGSGYTFSTWVRVDRYDPNCHTTIFGAYDDTQTFFLMAYLEKDTKCFILQTYMGHSAGVVPSVRFKKAPRLEQGKWYHIAVVHRRAKGVGLGAHKASLYINGEFTESMRAHYPSHPPVLSGSQESFASVQSHDGRQHRISAFVGTPRNLAPRLGRNVIHSKISMASFHLFSETLSDELLAVYFKLGPRYSGNFQDRLGSFQTYRTSAELHVRSEMLHPGKEERSDIVTAVRSNASQLVPESKIVLSFFPTSVLDDDDRNGVDESQLIRSLSKESAKLLHRCTRLQGIPIIINAAVPSVNDALSQSHGVGRLSAKAVVVIPQALDDAMWRVGGCAAVGLKLVQAARSLDDLLRAVQILLEAVEDNWRNCEAMEQNNGFALLAEVLRQKMGNATPLGPHGSSEIDMTPEACEAFILELLRVVLRFVGYDEACPADSLIINPLAYRILLVDLDLWRRSTSLEAQQLYYSQFIHFAKGSKYHHYNSRRFSRIRVVKRLTEALKGEVLMPQTFPHFLDSLKALLSINFNGENVRALSLFVTYALHDSRAAYVKPTLRPKASTVRLRKNTNSSTPAGSSPHSRSSSHDPAQAQGLSLEDLGISVLRMLTDLLCDPANHANIVRFAKNVTGKWILFLFAEPDQRVIVMASKILARLLIINGPAYVQKFHEKGGGFLILKHRLKHWWNTPGIWTICIAILFGRDVATIDFERDFDVYNLVDIFITHSPQSRLRIVNPGIFPVIVAMMEMGLRTIVRDQAHIPKEAQSSENGTAMPKRGRRRTMSLTNNQPPLDPASSRSDRLNDFASVLLSAIQFLHELHSRCEVFRDFAVGSNYVQQLLFILYPVVVTSDSVSAETELLSRGSLTFEGQDVFIKPLSKAAGLQAPIVRTTNVSVPPSPQPHRIAPFRRASSFVLVSTETKNKVEVPPPILEVRTPSASAAAKVSSGIVEAALEVVVDVFQDQIFNRKDFPGLGIFLKTPPGFQEHQAYFESYILRQTMSSITNSLQLDKKLLHEPRVLTNLARFVSHISEAVFEGWFLEGADPLLDFAGFVLEYLERPEVSLMKSVRLCTQAVSTIRTTFFRVVLLRLAESDDATDGFSVAQAIQKLTYWQGLIFSSGNAEGLFMRLICYLLYTMLSSKYEPVRSAAVEFWRLLVVQKPDDVSQILDQVMQGNDGLLEDFHKITEMENETFLQWLQGHKADLDALVYCSLQRHWDEFTQEQNKKTEESAQRRVAKRREKLRQWQNEDVLAERVWLNHEHTTKHFRSNVHASERIKHQRVLQDQQENITFLTGVMARLDKQMRGPCALFESSPPPQWRLDETEGRDRRRMRTIIDHARERKYVPRRRDTDSNKVKLDSTPPSRTSQHSVATPVQSRTRSSSSISTDVAGKDEGSGSEADDDFELVDPIHEDEGGFEDKNRKVMRSLNRNDEVQYVCNVSRVVGLEAIEGLLIVGKDCLYLLDDFFQRSDGEIVRVWQAPSDERDPCVQVIAGSKTASSRRLASREEGEATRNWKWNSVISVSKRRFLHRDVAMEIFFEDGRSYLLTVINSSVRNDVYSKLIARAQYVAKPDLLANSEIAWRLDSLRNPEEAPQTLGSRFASAFGNNNLQPATKKWLKGELSNFHYLMMVNTLAGRSFNDLTQYPVFPWVIADYTSEDLDLADPKTFRDLSRPIGCQDLEREQKTHERYQQLLEISEEPAFHYGTHYSSATTVAAYLTRLQPFCAASTLIHDGKFDHPDRMFYSIANAWESASRINMADVRELTPEFFYLPDFLTNVNSYNFGQRANGQSVDDVELPPWAHGDPAIFIAKQREALESPYVSQNLHKWIDLIFGYQQRGEAAIEAANVYRHQSYQGAVDLDVIDDQRWEENIQVIHNFGQTPYQVFQRPHPQKDVKQLPGNSTRLDTAVESLTRIPGTLLEAHDPITSLAFLTKQDKLLCTGPFRLNIPPTFDKYMEWGFADGSIRFYDAGSKRRIGLFEHLHVGQLTTCLFANGNTLITAGADCTVGVWHVSRNERSANVVEVVNKSMLYGHRKPVITLAASAALATLLTADAGGRVLLWDLNRLEFVRELEVPEQCGVVQHARINSSTGHVVLACGSRVVVTGLNGGVLVCQEIGETEEEISALAVHKGGNEWCARELVFVGVRGCVKIFQLAPDRTGSWALTLLKLLSHETPGREGRNETRITAVLPTGRCVYTGDEEGCVYEWGCVQRGR